MEPTEGSETSDFENWTPGRYPKEANLHSFILFWVYFQQTLRTSATNRVNVVIGRFVPWRISTDYAGWILPESENREGVNIKQWFFYFLLTVRLSIFISVINQLDAQNFCFAISLFHASTCFEHMCSSSGGPNCTTQPLVSSHHLVHRLREVLSQPVHQTATYRSDDTRGRVIQFWPPDDEHMCSKHVEAWHKLIVKQNFCALSWLITEINKQSRESGVVLNTVCANLHFSLILPTVVIMKVERTSYKFFPLFVGLSLLWMKVTKEPLP